MQSIRTKILLFTLLPLCITIVLIGGITIYNKNENEKSLILNRLVSYRTLLESGNLSFESLKDGKRLGTLIDETVTYAEITKKDGSILYNTEGTTLTTRNEKENLALFETFEGIETILNDGSVLEYVTPLVVNGKIVAALRIDLSYQKSKTRVLNYAFFIGSIGFVGIIICFVLILLLLNKTVLQNIDRLKKSTLLIERGDFDSSIHIDSKDEIGDLAETLDKMRTEVKNGRKGLEEANKRLEAQVKERTKELEEKLSELERLNKIMIGRELKMIELKKELDSLKAKNP